MEMFNQSGQKNLQKKPYNTPDLIEHGSLEKITTGGNVNVFDLYADGQQGRITSYGFQGYVGTMTAISTGPFTVNGPAD